MGYRRGEEKRMSDTTFVFTLLAYVVLHAGMAWWFNRRHNRGEW